MPCKPSSAAIVLGLLLSLSVAVIGSAFAPSNRNSLILPRQAFSQRPDFHTTTSSKVDKQEDGDDINVQTDSLRGGGVIVHLPKALPVTPTLKDFRKFALPCLALWVANPLLSLVDTSFVGLSGSASQSAMQLAALGPATTFFDGATYLFAFLNVATTNLYSSARARKGEQSDEAESVVRTASRVAVNCGLGLMIFLFVAARPLLKLYIGMCAGPALTRLDLVLLCVVLDFHVILSAFFPSSALIF
jgi:peptidoglycan biosynthesis protein MviN/MurJ (putative lipid II flippase)